MTVFMELVVSRIEPQAAKFLQLLVEFGHLDPRDAERVILAACEDWHGMGPVPLRSIKRVASIFLVGEDRPMEKGSDLLSSDWPLLFF